MSSVGTVVVTGGSGFIGSHLVEALLRDGFQVRVVDNLSTGRKENLAVARQLLQQPAPEPAESKPCATGSAPPVFVCRHCGAPMIVIETFARPQYIRAPPALLGTS